MIEWRWLKLKELIFVISIAVMSLYNSGQINIIEDRINQSIQNESTDFFMLKNGVQYFYKGKDKEAVEIVTNLLDVLPENVLIGVGEIHLEGKNGKIAGVTRGSIITLYDFMSYNSSSQKDILYHEVAHTFGNVMKYHLIIDNNYMEYSEYVKKDKNYVSDYSKEKIKKENNYSEDFADSFSEYFRNYNRFKRKYKNRYEYINYLIKELDLENLWKRRN